MRNYLAFSFILLYQIGFTQLLDSPEIKSGFEGKTIELDHQTSFSFRNYGDLWFSTLEELMEIGEIPGFDEEPLSAPVLIFPDSTIFGGYDITGRYLAQIHGIADIVNPTTLPTDYGQNWFWTKIVVDSVSIPYGYYRNTHDSIHDTVFIDYLNHVPFSIRVGSIPLNDNDSIDWNEFIHQPILHTGDTDELDDGMVFKTDTVVLSADDETVDFAKLINLNSNDTVLAGDRYGVYVRFRPGYDWNEGNDTITKYNMFGIFMREQVKGERPNVYWDPFSGFGSYLNTITSRHNIGSNSGQLLIGFVGDGSFEYEHAYIRYKIYTNELSLPEKIGLRELRLYPNPIRENSIVNLSLNAMDNQELNVQLFDVSGKLVFQEFKNVFSGENNLTFNLPNLSPGTYHFTIGDFAQKLVVK